MLKKQDYKLISSIAKRAWNDMKDYYVSMVDFVLDLECVKEKYNLDLKRLLEADDLDFYHDIYGIHNNLNRQTKQLDNCFIPRYCKC